jgi:hypothetical protein
MHDQGPYLQHLPDARLAPFALLTAPTFLYLSLTAGIVLTSWLAFVTALALRRAPLAVGVLCIGLVGLWLPMLPVWIITGWEDEARDATLPAALFACRIAMVGLGYLLYLLFKPHVRGHVYLDGAVLPTNTVVILAFAARYLAPGDAVKWLEWPILYLWTAYHTSAS